jgi:hypothetical protein
LETWVWQEEGKRELEGCRYSTKYKPKIP